MKQTKPVASPELTGELLNDAKLVQEYVEYLRSKVKRSDDGIYYCGSKEDDYDKCWHKTEQFCKKRKLDFQTVYEIFMIYGCESNIANTFNMDSFAKRVWDQRKGGKI